MSQLHEMSSIFSVIGDFKKRRKTKPIESIDKQFRWNAEKEPTKFESLIKNSHSKNEKQEKKNRKSKGMR